jgi:hypothetical protein
VRQVLLDWVCRAHPLGDVTALAVRRAIPASVLLPVAAAGGARNMLAPIPTAWPRYSLLGLRTAHYFQACCRFLQRWVLVPEDGVYNVWKAGPPCLGGLVHWPLAQYSCNRGVL